MNVNFKELLKWFIKRIRKKIRSYSFTSQDRRHSKVGLIGDWKEKREFQINFLRSIDLKPTHFLLDLGCGTLRGGIPIIKYLNERNYTGIDVRAKVIKEAKKELKLYHLEEKKPKLIYFKKFNELKFSKKFDVIWAFSVLIHLKDEMLDKCLEFIRNNLKQDGRFFCNVNVTPNEKLWRDFPLILRSLEFYENKARKHNLKIQIIGPAEVGIYYRFNDPEIKHPIIKFTKIE
ncbi:MAG: class I SAM-dependent methyltransferase [Promethearchaeota archaeon]|nr:MAG: class I SAM-dependent methyltransferase [Candidatus Lokiarchaeota archaeon]